MSENEIIKALKWLILNFPKQEEPNDDSDRLCNCINLYCQNAVDLINRQKAEIERLTRENIGLNRRVIPSSGTILKVGNALLFAENKEDYDITINTLKSKAYKELAERLKDNTFPITFGRKYRYYVISKEGIDNTLKELTEKGR